MTIKNAQNKRFVMISIIISQSLAINWSILPSFYAFKIPPLIELDRVVDSYNVENTYPSVVVRIRAT